MERKEIQNNNIKFYKEGIGVKRGIYPGSFDPITNGHIDIIERAAKLVDELIVAVLVNPNKGKGLFTISERIEMIEEVTKHLSNVQVEHFYGLLVDFADQKEANVIVRGMRSAKDLDMELSMAQINKHLRPNLETIFLMTAPEHAFMSSSAVRELVSFNGSYEAFVPKVVAQKINNDKVRGN